MITARCDVSRSSSFGTSLPSRKMVGWMCRLIFKISIGSCGVLFAADAHGWGWTGHAVVAYIAEARITPEVHRRVMQLLALDRSGLADPGDIGEQAAWADRYRDASPIGRATRQWHFVDLDRHRPRLLKACFGRRAPSASIAASDGPEAMCVVDKLSQFRRVLGDSSQSEHERLRALQFVLHLAGDIHQPMHAITDNDAGGNDIRVSTPRSRAESLHHLWDTTLVERLGPILVDGYTPADRLANAHAIADALLVQIERAEDRGATAAPGRIDREGAANFGLGDIDQDETARPGEPDERDLGDVTRFNPEAWAWESYDIARKIAYGPLRRRGASTVYRIGKRDEARALVAVATQLTRAGTRLARVLNDALGDPPR